MALLTIIMLRGPQTVGELRIHCERLHRFSDISSVEGFLHELARRATAARSSSNCRDSRARGKRAGRICCPDRPRCPPASRIPPADGERVTLGELAALKANVTQLQDEVATLKTTVERLMKDLGLPPA